MNREVICPACGAIVGAPDHEELVWLARGHTLDANSYDIPSEHVLAAASDGDAEAQHR